MERKKKITTFINWVQLFVDPKWLFWNKLNINQHKTQPFPSNSIWFFFSVSFLVGIQVLYGVRGSDFGSIFIGSVGTCMAWILSEMLCVLGNTRWAKNMLYTRRSNLLQRRLSKVSFWIFIVVVVVGGVRW